MHNAENVDSLAMSKLSENRFLMSEWDHDKNGAIGLVPEKLTQKSNKKECLFFLLTML